jgi:hypothetical protein
LQVFGCIFTNFEQNLFYNKIIAALDGIFGFSEGTLDSGNFEGTLFRFPLRNETTPLSDNVYSEKKILDLFNASFDIAPPLRQCMIIHSFSTRSPDVLVVLIAILKLDMNVSFAKLLPTVFIYLCSSCLFVRASFTELSNTIIRQCL